MVYFAVALIFILSRPMEFTVVRQGRSTNSRSPLTVASLFAGIGGIELGLESAGHETVFQCEVLDPAREVLREAFPDCDRRTDVTRLSSLPTVDLVTAGFPCQDLSQAGRAKGIRGSKSSQVDFVFDLLQRKRKPPEWILLENVPFMLQLDKGKAMRHVVKQIEGLGYRWAYRIVDARSFGLPQRRRRVIFLAARTEDPRDVLFADDVGEEMSWDTEAEAHGFYWTEGNRGIGWTLDGVPTLKGGSGFSIPSPPAIWMRHEKLIATPDIRDAERLQGFPAQWTMPSLRKVKTRKEAMRWKLVGNAVSVPVAKWVGRRLRTPGSYDPALDEPMLARDPWPTACWGEEGKAYIADVSEWPKHYAYRSLANYLRFPVKHLSHRATSGFYKRLRASQLRRPKEFDKSLEKHIRRMHRQDSAVKT